MAAFEYRYKVNGLVKAPAEVTGAVCQALIDQEGVAKPQRLVDVSRPVDAPLHNEFEWNDGVAAEKYRCEQARQIIKNIVAIDTSIEEEREIKAVKAVITDRAFVPTGENNHEYVTLKMALDNDKWRNNLLEAARKDLIAFRSKYYRLAELAGIINDIDEFLSA